MNTPIPTSIREIIIAILAYALYGWHGVLISAALMFIFNALSDYIVTRMYSRLAVLQSTL